MNIYSRTATLIRYICHNLQQIFVPLQHWQQIFVISWQQIHFRLCVCAFSLWDILVWRVICCLIKSGFHLPRCRDPKLVLWSVSCDLESCYLGSCDLWSCDLVILWSVILRSSEGKVQKKKLKKKLTNVSFMYVCVAGNGEMLVFSSFFPPTIVW